jgi:hypothetical protein
MVFRPDARPGRLEVESGHEGTGSSSRFDYAGIDRGLFAIRSHPLRLRRRKSRPSFTCRELQEGAARTVHRGRACDPRTPRLHPQFPVPDAERLRHPARIRAVYGATYVTWRLQEAAGLAEGLQGGRGLAGGQRLHKAGPDRHPRRSYGATWCWG